MNPDIYCQEKTANSGSSFYYSFRFLPKLQRRAITALYAFCREVDDVVDECNDEAIARTKLNWWRSEIASLYAGKPQHPVTHALLPLLDEFNLAEEYLMEIIDGMEMDLDYHSYPSFKDLSLYCYRVASVVGLLAAEIFGYKDRMTQRYAHDLGMAFQLTNILRDVREDAERGRVYIPADELKQFGVSIQDLHRPITSDAVKALFQHQASRAREYYQKAYNNLPEQDRYNQRTGLMMAEIYSSLLAEIEDDGFRVLEHKIKLTPLRKLWLAWTVARREKKRYTKYLQAK
ncbi:MAG: presqualene diphosphate synthase HpnD [Gammaproteobacteria bacterium]|nr:presqualene diphosphate synthase HpnD [Gammaproteobacteria bacterium]